MNNINIRTGLCYIFAANIVNIVFSVGNNFLLPKYLSIEAYSDIKLYQLYLIYLAVFHFGYNDGMYLKYGGKKQSEIYEDLSKDISTLRGFQSLIMLACCAIAFVLGKQIFLFASFCLLSQNVIAYYRNLYQAVGEYKRYSEVLNFANCFIFFLNFSLLLIADVVEAHWFILGYVLINVITWLLIEWLSLYGGYISSFGFRIYWKYLRENILSGLPLLLGNYCSVILTSIDRICVKVFLGMYAFGQYAFAVSMETFINMLINPLAIVFYNYLHSNLEYEKVIRLRKRILVFSALIIGLAFPIKFIIVNYFDNFIESVDIVFWLFAAQGVIAVIKVLYVNLYKVLRLQKQYFNGLAVVVFISVIFNIILYLLLDNIIAFAVGTFLSSLVWLVICHRDFKDYSLDDVEYLYLFLVIVSYFFIGCRVEIVFGVFIYYCVVIFLTWFLLPQVISDIWGYVRKFCL